MRARPCRPHAPPCLDDILCRIFPWHFEHSVCSINTCFAWRLDLLIIAAVGYLASFSQWHFMQNFQGTITLPCLSGTVVGRFSTKLISNLFISGTER